MASCSSTTANTQRGLLGHLVAKLYEHLQFAIASSVILVAVFSLQLRRLRTKLQARSRLWTDHEKALVDLPELVSDYSHPLEQALFQPVGIPTSGDLARRALLDDCEFAHSPLSIYSPTSGDLAAMATPISAEEQRHPWRRHSYPERQSSGGNLNQHQVGAAIREDAVEFFKDDKVGQIWRRRTLEFGSISSS